MFIVCAADVAIIRAIKNEDLTVSERDGRFGKFVAICDSHGVIEVADDLDEAYERVADIALRMEMEKLQ